MDRTRRQGAGRPWREPSEPDPAASTTVHETGWSPARVTGEGPRLTVGSRLLGGRLEIRGVVGEGGMGIVHVAFDKERSELVAVKTLTRVAPAEIYRLKQEFRSIAGVVHPNLVRLHELFVDDGFWFFSMEMVEGRSFTDHVRPDNWLDLARLRATLPQLLDGVLAIHAEGKLHRDLKPSNVLVTDDGRVVVLDFGLVTDRGHAIDEPGVAGTPYYMAPEQATGAVDATTDVYAIGVMLYEALTGDLPFRGNALSVLRAKQERDAPRPGAVAKGVPADLDQLCSELLAREPRLRPDAAALRARLGPGLAREPSLPPRLSLASPARVALVGRARERAALLEAFEASGRGEKPVVLLVSGESGIGKSALVESVAAELTESRGALVLCGRCYEREVVPYKGFDAVIDALSRYLMKSTEYELAQLLPRDVWALRRLFPVLARVELIALAAERDVPDAQELRHRAFLALGQLLARICERTRLVISVDDLQWNDADSSALLLHLLRQPDAPRLLFIGAHRDEEVAAHPSLRLLYETLPGDLRLDVRRLALGPLSEAEALELAERHAAPDAAALAREAGGNPFLLGELSRRAPAAGERQGGAPSLASALRARVSLLPPRERKLLEVLAVAARPLPLELAAQAAQVRHGARSAMDGLREALLGRSAGQPGSVECYHDRIREAVTAGLPEAELRAHHRALAEALSRRAGADPEHLSAHYEQAGERELAARHALQAAARAVRLLAFERAVSFYERALSLGQFDAAEIHQLRVARAEALSHAGRGPEAAEAYLEARDGADSDAQPVLLRKAAEQFLMSGSLERGHALLADALGALGVALPRRPLHALGSLLYLRGRQRLRGLRIQPAREVVQSDARKLEALLASGSALSRTDALFAAEAAARHLALALEVGSEVDVARALVWEVLFSTVLGEPSSRVREVMRLAEQMCDRTGDLEARASLHRHRGFFLYFNPEPDLSGALSELEASLALHRDHPLPTSFYDRPWGEWNRATVRGYLGHSAAVARELPAQLDEAWARADLCIAPMWAALVQPRLAIGDLDGAERDLARARGVWNAPGFTLQDLSLLQGAYHVGHYRGDPRSVWERIERDWERLARSPLQRGSALGSTLRGLRAGTAAALAARTPNRRERTALIGDVRTGADALRRTARASWTSRLADPLYAIADLLSGDEEAGVRRLRLALERLAPIPLMREVCRRQLGGWIGGSEGAGLVAAADQFFREHGVVDPERFAAGVMPGFDRH